MTYVENGPEFTLQVLWKRKIKYGRYSPATQSQFNLASKVPQLFSPERKLCRRSSALRDHSVTADLARRLAESINSCRQLHLRKELVGIFCRVRLDGLDE